MKKLLIIGAGDQPKIIIDAIESNPNYKDISIKGLMDVEGRKENVGKEILGHRIVGTLDKLAEYLCDFYVIAVGDPAKRKEIDAKVAETGKKTEALTIIHKSAIVSKHVKIGSGSMISAGAIILPNAILGRHCIINTSATIDHDCELGDYVNISPGAKISGNVKIGECATIGTGATIIDGVTIGKNAIIGAGASVISDIPADSTAVGVPAKVIKKG
ncbi:MAG: acetyltransferase [Candidatus Micrarchaeota archaeon]